MKETDIRDALNNHFIYPEKCRPKGWNKRHDDITTYDKKHNKHPIFKK